MSFNDKLADELIDHTVDLEKLSAGQKRRAISVLDKLQKQLKQELRAADFTGTAAERRAYRIRLENLLQGVRQTIKTAYDDIHSDVDKTLRGMVWVEDDVTRSLINGIAGVNLAKTGLSQEQFNAIMSDALIQGSTQQEVWAEQSAYMIKKYSDTVRMGLLRGDSTDKIVETLDDNAFRIAEKTTETLVRTSITSVSNTARLQMMANNQKVIPIIQQRSVLDLRTSDVCKAYSGLSWENAPGYRPIGHNLPFLGGPPRHWRCRSSVFPVVASLAALAGLKERRFTAEDDKLFRERLKAHGFDAEAIQKTRYGAQAAMNGAVPKDLTYEDWLKTKSADYQRRALGDEKYELWKKGKISLIDLVNRDNQPLTIEQLQAKARRRKSA